MVIVTVIKTEQYTGAIGAYTRPEPNTVKVRAAIHGKAVNSGVHRCTNRNCYGRFWITGIINTNYLHRVSNATGESQNSVSYCTCGLGFRHKDRVASNCGRNSSGHSIFSQCPG